LTSGKNETCVKTFPYFQLHISKVTAACVVITFSGTTKNAKNKKWFDFCHARRRERGESVAAQGIE